MKDFVLVFLIGSSLWIDINDAFPTGAPESACETLTPRHGNIEPQRSENPYTVTATKSGNSVKVKISGIVGEKFEGFVMQARSAFEKNRLIEGKFTTRSNISQTINCQSGRQNTITQVNKGKKSEIITEWTPAGGVTEDVIFRATVAKTFALFWIKTDSQPVKISSSSASSRNSEEMYDDCFMNKGCFGHPLDCVERQNCDIFVSYVDSADGVKFTMHGTLSSGQYMATGLSFDKRMGEDSVTECFVDGSRVVAQHSWNEGYSNRPDTQIPEGMYEWSLRNGLASCTWVRPYITYPGVKTINLKDETYYVLMAKGPMLNNRLSRHEVRIASQQAVNFTAYEMIEGAGADDAVKIHGTFMVTGWIAFVSIGILMARHFKTVWDDKMLFGVKLWFAIHRSFMIIALLFIVVAFIVIFVHRNGWNYETSNPHAVLGCIATALGLFQPIMAAFRPSPDHPKRKIFNWLHWGVGNVAQIFAIVTIFFAVSLEASGLEESFYWVMGVFVVVHYCVHIVFQLHAFTQEKKKNNEIKMQELGSARGNSMQNNINKTLPADVFKVLVLGIYGIFLTVIMLALYALIGTA